MPSDPHADGGGAEPPPAWLLWWEGRTPRFQIAVVLPVALVAMFAFHVGFFPHLPLGLDITYAIFWGLVLTALVVVGTRNEARKRRQREHGEEPGDG